MNRSTRIELLEARCREKGLPVTVHRRVVLDALLARRDHPTVDQLLQDVKDRIPGISRTTVYRTLETLVKLGMVRRTHHSDAFARFDGNIDHHHHLVCVQCGRVADVSDPKLDELPLPDLSSKGFQIVDFSVLFEGLCQECRRTGNPSPQGTKKRRPLRAVAR